MAFDMSKHLVVGAKVKVANPMDVPEDSVWDDDKGRTSPMLKKRLQAKFFQGVTSVFGEIVYIANSTEREMLRRKGLVKLRIRDQSGVMLRITANPKWLLAAR